jgi:LysR family hydrogen peroxide-inducible transcriptional activator
MNLRDLHYIVSVAEHEHFGKAAEQCCVSQPTLSGQIKKLEEELGVTLFERTNRRVMVTDIGEHIIHSARRILNEAETIKELAETANDPLAGTFRLGAFPTLAPYYFPQLVPKIKTELPKLRLILVEEKTDILIQQLKAGQLDAALLALPIEDNFLICQKLFEDEFLLATASDHALASEKVIRQDALAGESLLLLEEGHCLRDQALDACQLLDIGEEPDFKATSLETLRQMVKAGTGITFMPKLAIKEKGNDIRYLPFQHPPSRRIGLVWRKTAPKMPVIEKLLELA